MKYKKYLFILLSCLLVGCIADCFIPRPCIKRQGASIQTIYYQPSQEEGRRPVLTAEQEQSVLDILADSRRQQTLIAPPGGMGDYLYVAVDTQEGQIQIHLFISYAKAGSFATGCSRKRRCMRGCKRFYYRMRPSTMRERPPRIGGLSALWTA